MCVGREIKCIGRRLTFNLFNLQYHLNVTKEVVEINLYDGEYTPEQRGWVLRITENP